MNDGKVAGAWMASEIVQLFMPEAGKDDVRGKSLNCCYLYRSIVFVRCWTYSYIMCCGNPTIAHVNSPRWLMKEKLA